MAQLFSCEFCEISKNTFFTEHPLACYYRPPWRLLLLVIDLSLNFLSPLYNLVIFYDSCSYLSSLLFLIPKTEFVSFFAFVLCSVLSFLLPTEHCETVILIEKCKTLFSRLFLARQNATRIFRIILNIIAFYHSG